MNYRANSDPLPKLIAPMLENGRTLIDNLLSETWQQLKIPTRLARAGIAKRSGHEAGVLVYLHLMWRWMTLFKHWFFLQKVAAAVLPGAPQCDLRFSEQSETELARLAAVGGQRLH